MAFSHDGKVLAVGDFNGEITIVRASEPETLKAHHKKEVRSLAFSPNDTILASASADGTIMLHSWDGQTWKSAPKSLGKDMKPVNSVAFSPAKTTSILVSGGEDGLVFWDVASGERLAAPLEDGKAVNSVAFSPDGTTLASGRQDGTIVLWNTATRQPLGLQLDMHTDSVLAVAFSPNGKILASGGQDTAVIFWDVATGQVLDVPFREHMGAVTSVAFSPDGKTLASGGADKSIILWDVATPEPIGSLVTEDENATNAMAFSRDGLLVSAGTLGVTSWDVEIKSLRRKADVVAGRNLTPKEWKRFLGDRPPRPTSVSGLLKEADILALQGDVEGARKVFKEAVEMAAKSEDAVLNNEVAWYGTLDKFADIVLPACSRAIDLAQDAMKSICCDTQGVAFAMTGKFPEAIEDLEATADWLRGLEKRELEAKTDEGKENAVAYKKMREKRQEWIEKLKSDQNPFDDATLMSLRREEGAPGND